MEGACPVGVIKGRFLRYVGRGQYQCLVLCPIRDSYQSPEHFFNNNKKALINASLPTKIQRQHLIRTFKICVKFWHMRYTLF